MLEQLAVVVAVSLRRLELRRALEVEHPLADTRVGVQAPCRPDRQHQVVARVVLEVAEVRPEHAGALVDEQHLVALAVAVEGVGRHRVDGRTTPSTTSALWNSGTRPETASPGGCKPRRVDELVMVRAVVGGLDRDRAQGSIRVTRVGGARWYSSELRPVKPSTPNSSSAYRPPSGARCWVWRVGGTEPPRDVVHGDWPPRGEEASLGRAGTAGPLRRVDPVADLREARGNSVTSIPFTLTRSGSLKSARITPKLSLPLHCSSDEMPSSHSDLNRMCAPSGRYSGEPRPGMA